jgi:hypothetical protein
MNKLQSPFRVLSAFNLTAMLLLAAGAPGSLPKGVPAAASTGIVKEVIPFEDLLVPNFCTGELISETGAVTTWFKFTLTPGGRLLLQFRYQFKAVGIGDLGNEYIINQEAKVKEIFGPAIGDDFTFVDKFVQISKGPGDNTFFFFTYRIVIEADGTVRMEITDVKFDCQG